MEPKNEFIQSADNYGEVVSVSAGLGLCAALKRDGKIIDHLFTHEGLIQSNDETELTYYIGDSKYYKIGHSLGDTSIYKQYTYAPINIAGAYSGKNLTAHITLDDKNIQLKETTIKYDGNKALPIYEFKMQVDSFSPFNLGLTNIHEDNFLSFRLSSKITGNNPENSNINTIINDFTLTLSPLLSFVLLITNFSQK